jgi:hypothetical protein
LKNKTISEFIAEFLDDLSKEGLIHGTPAEYRRGFPNASDEEIQLLFDAGKKSGAMPYNLAHARLIMSDNVFALTAAPGSPHGRGAKRFSSLDHWPVPDKRLYPTVGVLVMARTMQEFAAEFPDHAPPDMLAYAIGLEQRALDAIHDGVAELMVEEDSIGDLTASAVRPPPTPKDFDDAVLAVMAADREHKLQETVKLAASVLREQ